MVFQAFQCYCKQWHTKYLYNHWPWIGKQLAPYKPFKSSQSLLNSTRRPECPQKTHTTRLSTCQHPKALKHGNPSLGKKRQTKITKPKFLINFEALSNSPTHNRVARKKPATSNSKKRRQLNNVTSDWPMSSQKQLPKRPPRQQKSRGIIQFYQIIQHQALNQRGTANTYLPLITR